MVSGEILYPFRGHADAVFIQVHLIYLQSVLLIEEELLSQTYFEKELVYLEKQSTQGLKMKYPTKLHAQSPTLFLHTGSELYKVP